MNDTDNRAQEMALRVVAFRELAKPETDWQARCLAAESERDALAAELAKVKAGLPKWRKVSDGHLRLHYGSKDFVAGVQSQNNGLWSVHTMVICGRLFPSCEAAMLAVTEALGLPSCEVEE